MSNVPSKGQRPVSDFTTRPARNRSIVLEKSQIQESAYWRALKAGLVTLFGSRVRITNLRPKKSGGRHG
jgi:hypothetical protein